MKKGLFCKNIIPFVLAACAASSPLLGLVMVDIQTAATNVAVIDNPLDVGMGATAPTGPDNPGGIIAAVAYIGAGTSSNGNLTLNAAVSPLGRKVHWSGISVAPPPNQISPTRPLAAIDSAHNSVDVFGAMITNGVWCSKTNLTSNTAIGDAGGLQLPGQSELDGADIPQVPGNQAALIVFTNDVSNGNSVNVNLSVQSNTTDVWETISTKDGGVELASVHTAASLSGLFASAAWTQMTGMSGAGAMAQNIFEVRAVEPVEPAKVLANVDNVHVDTIYATRNSRVMQALATAEDGKSVLAVADESVGTGTVLLFNGDPNGWNITPQVLSNLFPGRIIAMRTALYKSDVAAIVASVATTAASASQANLYLAVGKIGGTFFIDKVDQNVDSADTTFGTQFTPDTGSLETVYRALPATRTGTRAGEGIATLEYRANVGANPVLLTTATPQTTELSELSPEGTAVIEAQTLPFRNPSMWSSGGQALSVVGFVVDVVSHSTRQINVAQIITIPGVICLQAKQVRRCKKVSHLISWRFNPQGPEVEKYEIFTDARLQHRIGVVFAKRKLCKGCFCFKDCSQALHYYLVTVYADGTQSDAQKVSVRGCKELL